MPRRTKACAICRKKRIKCDATMPHCNMCKKYGRQCPGPVDAPLTFVDTSAYPSGKRPRKKPSPPTTTTTTTQQPLSTGGPVRPKAGTASLENLDHRPTATANTSAVLAKLTAPTAFTHFPRVSSRHVLNEALFANLTFFFCANGRSFPGAAAKPATWLNSIPRMAVQPYASSTAFSKTDAQGREVLSLAIRAMTAAFGGLECRDTGLLEYASGLYGEALRAQRRTLLGNVGREVSMDMVATSVILGMFEAIVATTERAFVEHIVGAGKMLNVAIGRAAELRGTQKVEELVVEGGPVWEVKKPSDNDFGMVFTQIFYHTRRQLAFICATARDDRVRKDPVVRRVLEDACEWPFPLPLDQQLMRPLGVLIRLNGEKELDMTLAREYEEAKDEVELLQLRFEKENRGPPMCWFNEKTGRLDFRNPLTAIQYGYFSACRVLMSRISAAISSMLSPSPTLMVASLAPADAELPLRPYYPLSSQSHAYSQGFQQPALYPDSPPADEMTAPQPDHFSLILDVTTYLKVRNVGMSYLRLHLPLFMVAKYAPLREQRATARHTFEEWEGGTLRGIGLLGLRGLNDR